MAMEVDGEDADNDAENVFADGDESDDDYFTDDSPF